jgi:galactoside O-acetyltransferase
MDKLKFKAIGENVTIYDPVTFIYPDLIVLNNNIIISEFSFINAGLGLFVGNYIHISPHTSIMGGGYCILEDFVGLSAGVRLITGNDDYSGRALTNPTIPSEYRNIDKSFIHCKKHSLLATNVVVHPGVTIGEGAVAASNSLVTKDLEPWSIYIGIPAKKVKEREKDKILKYENELKNKYNFKNSDYRSFIKY